MKKPQIIILASTFILAIISLFYDQQITTFTQSIQNPVMTAILKLTEPLFLALLFIFLALFLAYYKDKRKYTIPLVLSLAAAIIISFALKFTFMRPRPFGLEKLTSIFSKPDYSFPSTHTASAFSAIPIINKAIPALQYAWITLAVLISFSRLYFGLHYLSDILFGGIIGYLIGYFIIKKYN